MERMIEKEREGKGKEGGQRLEMADSLEGSTERKAD